MQRLKESVSGSGHHRGSVVDTQIFLGLWSLRPGGGRVRARAARQSPRNVVGGSCASDFSPAVAVEWPRQPLRYYLGSCRERVRFLRLEALPGTAS